MKEHNLHEQLLRDLESLRLSRIAETYKEILDQAFKEGWSFLQVIAHLVGSEASTEASTKAASIKI